MLLFTDASARPFCVYGEGDGKQKLRRRQNEQPRDGRLRRERAAQIERRVRRNAREQAFAYPEDRDEQIPDRSGKHRLTEHVRKRRAVEKPQEMQKPEDGGGNDRRGFGVFRLQRFEEKSAEQQFLEKRDGNREQDRIQNVVNGIRQDDAVTEIAQSEQRERHKPEQPRGAFRFPETVPLLPARANDEREQKKRQKKKQSRARQLAGARNPVQMRAENAGGRVKRDSAERKAQFVCPVRFFQGPNLRAFVPCSV